MVDENEQWQEGLIATREAFNAFLLKKRHDIHELVASSFREIAFPEGLLCLLKGFEPVPILGDVRPNRGYMIEFSTALARTSVPMLNHGIEAKCLFHEIETALVRKCSELPMSIVEGVWRHRQLPHRFNVRFLWQESLKWTTCPNSNSGSSLMKTWFVFNGCKS